MPDRPPPEIILASGSPRRRQLLAELGVTFVVKTAEVTELEQATATHFSPSELAVENAEMKAAVVARENPECWVLGADTVVALDGRIFGKPPSQKEAFSYLHALSGKTHEVITGCAFCHPNGRGWDVFHVSTEVTFKPLSDDLIRRYLAEVHVLDKAGAYALQERGDWIVERVVGSETNVIGLPMERLREVFVERGLL